MPIARVLCSVAHPPDIGQQIARRYKSPPMRPAFAYTDCHSETLLVLLSPFLREYLELFVVAWTWLNCSVLTSTFSTILVAFLPQSICRAFANSIACYGDRNFEDFAFMSGL